MNDPLTGRPDAGAPGGMTGFGNPSVNVTLSTQNGTAVTAMRSDAAPALSQAITPTWTSYHTWNVSAAGDSIRCTPNASATSNTDHKSSPVISIVANVWNGAASTAKTAQWASYGFAGTNSIAEMYIGYTEASFLCNTRGDALAGKKQALNTTDDAGFFFIRGMAGTPSGTPTTYTGMTPMVFDTTASKLWAYIGGAWKSVTLA